METLIALGVAGNVIQFVDFAQRLIAKTVQIYRSADGASRDRRTLEAVLRDFALLQPKLPRDEDGALFGRLEVELNAKGVDKTIQHLVGHSKILGAYGCQETTTKTPVQSVAQECCKVANGLLDDVEKLKARGQRRAWRSLKVALVDLWKETELVEFQRKLTMYKSQLEQHVLILLR